MFRIIVGLLLLFLLLNQVYSHSVPDKAKAFIITPIDGARVSSPVIIKFGIEGFLIAPVGENIHKAGHYHLLIDLEKALPLDELIPMDDQHLHFNQGETEVVLHLSPGKHTLQLVVGDEEHEPFEELLSKQVTIYVNK